MKGRKPKNIPLDLISDALQRTKSVYLAAKELGCSRGYIYQELNRYQITLDDVFGGKE